MPAKGGRRATGKAVFKEGDLALLIDRKGRRYLVKLDQSKDFHSHLGVLPHSAIIGQEVGCRVVVPPGHKFLVVKPTLADYIPEIPRVSQVIYPKDVGVILMRGDVFPGARVLEAGMGSGALTLALLRAVGGKGHVYAYEIREEIVKQAVKNVAALYGEAANLTVRVRDVYDGILEKALDRIIFDLPEPWGLVEQAERALLPGGILLSYLPTVLQVHRLVESLNAHPRFDMVETVEVLERPWHVTHQSVRPVHRMVAHTGFISTARKCAEGKPIRVE